MPVAIIGAGMAGLACARALTLAGETVVVFDKSRGVGGRCATRRGDHGDYDHGAPYVQAWTVNFKAMLAAGVTTGSAREWPAMDASETAPAFVGLPGMNAIVKPLVEGSDIRLARLVSRIERQGGSWALSDDAGVSLGVYDTLCLAIPSPQAQALLGAHSFAEEVSATAMSPCWTLMATVPEPFQAAEASGSFEKIVIQSDKPGRERQPARIVAHMTAAWSRAHLEIDAGEAALLITAELAQQFGLPRHSFTHASAHRWRYARTETVLGQSCLWDENQKLGVCGDWCLGLQAEQAFLSGTALAGRILGR